MIGREVDRDLLHRAVGVDGAEFERRLRTLLDAGLMELAGAQLRFRHELIREVAYETQRRTVLRERHGIVADLLASGEDAGQRASTVAAAFHLEQAGRVPHAVAAHIQIAQADQALGAHEEAAERLTKVLELLETHPGRSGAGPGELAVRELRSFSAVTARGYAAVEAAEDYPRCLQLVEESVRDAEVLPYLIRLWTYYTSRGDFTQAEAINEAVIRRTEAAGVFFPGAALGRGVVDFFQGDFTDAVAQLTDAVENGWTADVQAPPEWTLPNDPRAAGFAHLVPSWSCVGDRAAAEQAAVDGLERANSLPYPIGPFSAQYVDCLLAVARSIDGDVVGAAEVGQRLVAVGERHGFAIWSLTGQMQCLYSAVQLGDTSCLPGLVQAVEVWHQVVAIDSWTPYWFANVGFAHLLTGDAGDGGRLLRSRAGDRRRRPVRATTPPRRCADGARPGGRWATPRPPRPTWPRPSRSPNVRGPCCSPPGPGRPWTHRHDGGPDDRPRSLAGSRSSAAAWPGSPPPGG